MEDQVLELRPPDGVPRPVTTLLDFLQYRFNVCGTPAITVRFRELGTRTGFQGLLSVVADALGESKAQAERLLQGGLTLLIDDGRAGAHEPEWEVLHTWLDAAPSLRVIIACGSVGGVPRALECLPQRWRVVALQPMSFSAIRQELKRIERLSALANGKWDLERALETIVDAELPRWPWVLLMFVELSSRGHATDISNLGTLLRLYSELRLGAFDYGATEAAKIKSRMLRLIAANMSERHEDWIERAIAVALVAKELQTVGFDDDPGEIVSALTRTGLIVAEGSRLSFAFIVFQEFFYAEYLREMQWSQVDALTPDTLVRMSGALVFLAESVKSPGLIEKALGIAEASSPSTTLLRLDQLSRVGDLLAQATADEAITDAQGSVPTDQDIDADLDHRHKEQTGTRRRRIKNGESGLQRLTAYREHLFIAVALLRSSMWADRGAKASAVHKAIELAAVLVSELAIDEEVIRFLGNEADLSPENRSFIDIVNAISVLLVAAMVAGTGGARHLAPSIKDAFESENDELKRLLLLLWYTEIEGSDAEALTRSFVRESSSAAAAQLCELFVTMRYVNSLTFGSSNAARQEALLRFVITERIRRTSDSRHPDVARKMSADQAVQAAKKLRTKVSKQDAVSA